ncbi:MAG TPA: phage holin family protein [Candidatus Nanopelagicales bacterium]|nr:phage holin family protein [Candidatus Nanopelagicales bacterium]
MAEKQQSLGSLVSGITEDLSALVRGEIELAKTEVRTTMQTASKGGGMLAGAALFGFLALVFLLLTLAWVLVQLGLPIWAGFGIVTLLLIIVTAILGILGKKRLDEVQAQGGLVRTQASIEETKAALSRKPVTAAEPAPVATSAVPTSPPVARPPAA